MAVNPNTSKKQSDVSLPSLPEQLVFFIDRSLGRRIIPDMLRLAGEVVKIHDDLFRQDTKDEVWLSEAGKNGWVVLTKDKNIRYRTVEIRALVAAKVRAFVLTARCELNGTEIGQILVDALPSIKRLCRDHQPPFIAHVSRDSKVTLRH